MNLTKTVKVLAVGLLCPLILTAQIDHGRNRMGRLVASQSALASKILTDSVFILAPGLEETELSYLNAKGLQMHVFIIRADLSQKNIHLRLLTPDHKPATGMQPITAMIKAADTPTERVLAAVNGDFYNMQTGIPMGIAYQDGRGIKDTFANNSLKPQQGLSYLGVNRANQAMIGLRKDSSKKWSGLLQASGGGVVLVKNGIVTEQTVKTLQPRTGVGLDGAIIYFVVIDGRKPAYSQGMAYLEMGLLMKTIGAKDAINLDGGGSSEIVIRRKGRSPEVRNKPADGFERALSNAWGITCTKKD